MRSVHAAKVAGRSAPLELVDVPKERRVGLERGELLEQERVLAPLAQHLGRKVFDRTVAIEQARGADGPDTRNARDSRPPRRRRERGSRGSARARRRISCARHRRPESPWRRGALARRGRSRTHCARSLSTVQMQTLSTRSSSEAIRAADASASSASSSTIGQTATPIAASASSSGWNCANSAGSMPSPVL